MQHPQPQFVGACFVPGTPAHSWQMTAQGKEKTAVKGMFYAAQVLSEACRRLFEKPEIVKQAREVFENDTVGNHTSAPSQQKSCLTQTEKGKSTHMPADKKDKK